MMRTIRRRPKERDEISQSASESVDRQPTWLEEVSLAPHRETGTTPLISWIGQAATPSIRSAPDETAIRLHFLVVDHLPELGYVVAGWLVDPFSTVVTLSIDGATGEKLDLLSEAILLTDRHQLQGFETPRGIPVKFGFVLLVPDRPPGTTDGLHVRLRLVAGGTYNCVVPPVGDISQLSDISSAAPLDYGLSIIERLLNAWRSRGGRSQRPPERLAALAGRIHQRIDPGRDHGAHLGHRRADCNVDVAIRVGTMGMLLAGWLNQDCADEVKEIALVSLFGRRVALDAPLPTNYRPDAPEAELGTLARIDCGFATFVPIEELDPFDTLWFLEVIMAAGAIRRVPFICAPELPPLQGIKAAVALVEKEGVNLPDLFERAISPAVEWFWSQTRGCGLNSTEGVYGSPPSDARVSVIVPVYGRLDFVRHQIARFSNDPEFRAHTGTVELIYVLDDPTKADEFTRLCRFLHDVYGVPFRTLVQSKNRGYSSANNAGAAIARGDLLLLLNSDVFPDKPRWVAHLVKTYDRLDSCGVLGCRLLFEDGSIQHAGMSFRDSRMAPGCWENGHPGQGLSVPFDTHAGAEPVPAVTGACLMIGRALFDKLGGMSEEYVIADFEDSDLCLRVQEQGLKVYYTPEVELYHLERQSMRLIGDGMVRWRQSLIQSLMLYNMWKHSRLWGEFIPKILGSYARVPESGVFDHRPSRGDEGVASDVLVVPDEDRTERIAQRPISVPGRSLKNRRPTGIGKRSRGKA
jgi:GT2 family glycosyltransferase